jgi:hypothetical protein
MTWRQRKKFFYGVVFAVIAILILGILFLLFKPKPSCFDRKQNQSEKGIDCGGPCLDCEIFKLTPLKIHPAQYLIYEDGSMDLLAEIENPNKDYGVKEFDYKFVLTGENGEIREATGKSFILPLRRKYVLSINKATPEFIITSVNLQVNFPPANWQKLRAEEESAKEVKIELLNYDFVADEIGQVNSIRAEIINSGNLDYEDIALKFIAIDSEENIIAATISQISKLEPAERQIINATLPPISITPAKIIFEAESNTMQ